MITRNEKAKGLWWRLLATLPVLAVLLIANTKVTAQEMKADKEDSDSMTVIRSSTDGDITAYNITSSEDLKIRVTHPDNDTVFQTVDEMPRYPGGEQAMFDFIGKNVKYPQEAQEKGIAGRVMVSFIVEKDGSVSNVKVLRGIGGGCDEESVRVISALPKWKPGKQNGKPVRVSFNIPIIFKLDNDISTAKSNEKENVSQADKKSDGDEIYQTVDEMPEFPGGIEALLDYVSKNVKYPESAKENNLQGRVLVKFVIEKDGTVTNVEVGRGWGNELDDEAVRVMKAMPKWKPGKQDGKPVRVSFMLPINFKLGDGTPSKGPLMGTTWTGTGTGKKGKVTYEMSWTIDFTDGRDGMIMMTLWSQEKKGEKKVEFDDVPLPFEYTYDGKSTGSINPVNPDNTPMGGDQIPPYGFIINSDNTMRINLFDFKKDTGIGEIVLKKQK